MNLTFELLNSFCLLMEEDSIVTCRVDWNEKVSSVPYNLTWQQPCFHENYWKYIFFLLNCVNKSHKWKLFDPEKWTRTREIYIWPFFVFQVKMVNRNFIRRATFGCSRTCLWKREEAIFCSQIWICCRGKVLNLKAMAPWFEIQVCKSLFHWDLNSFPVTKT